MISREILQDHLEMLLKQREQLAAQLNAHDGAIEVLRKLLELDKDEDEG